MAKNKDEEKKALSRREFLKDTGMVVGGAALTMGALSLAGCASPEAETTTVTRTVTGPGTTVTTTKIETATPWLPSKWDYEADVVICGYGSVGMPAAIEAYDAGAKDIIVIEKQDWLGGEGRRCGGGILQAESVVQKKLGIVDSKDDLYNYIVACGEGYVDPELLRSFANNDNVDWVIEELGGQPVDEWQITPGIPIVPDDTPDEEIPLSGDFGLNYSATPVYFSKYGFKPVMRCHWFNGDPAQADFKAEYAGWAVQNGPNGGTGVFKTLNAAIEARTGIRVIDRTGLVGLVTAPDREVLGITAADAGGRTLYIKARKGVIIGTGGWSRNKEMVEKYLLVSPSEFNPPVNPSTQAIEGQEDGTGILAALAIGADVFLMGAGGGSVIRSAGFEFERESRGQHLGSGGLKINVNCQVIDIYGQPIPRLYAGAHSAGGVMFRQYPTCGFAFSTAIWHGRVAAKQVAALEPWG